MKLHPLLRMALSPLSIVYGAYVSVRALGYERGWLKQKRLKATVISVGNLTVGGTGKTPMVIWLAERFLAAGKRVAILSRGYRGTDGTSDEIELMKFRLQGHVEFGVGGDRFASGQLLEAQKGVDVFLLDDGFQHMQLARDVDILLIDASRPMAKDWLLPAGNLREPISAMGRADLLVFTRTENMPGTTEAIANLREYPVFSAQTRLLGFRRMGGVAMVDVEQIGAGPFLAFCGIGNPQAFFRDLVNWKFEVCGNVVFRDHHRYSKQDAERLQQAAQNAGAKAFLTTEKDAQNLKNIEFGHLPAYVAVIEFAVNPGADFLKAIADVASAGREATA